MHKILALILFLPQFALLQVTHPQNGVLPSKPRIVAIKNADILVSPSQTIQNATLVIEDGRIAEVGKLVIVPKDALEIDGKGWTIVPAFIDLNSQIGMPELSKKPYTFRPQFNSTKDGSFYWNESIHPEFRAAENYTVKEKDIEKYRQMGFGVLLTHLNDGIAQGQGAVVNTQKDIYKSLILSDAGAFYSFDKGVSRQTYPSSQMGSIALLRQAFLDAEWYGKTKNAPIDLSLEALNKKTTLHFFHVETAIEIERALKVMNEFNRNTVILGEGDEYLYAKELNQSNARVVIPIDFPKAFEVKDPYVHRYIPLSALETWELAPYNAHFLNRWKVPFALTAQGCESADEFWKNIGKLVETGLTQKEILASLTTIPAQWLGIESDYGTLEKGKMASFSIFNENPLERKADLLETWVNGERQVWEEMQTVDIRGSYNFLIDGLSYPIEISGTIAAPKAEMKLRLEGEETTIKPVIEVTGNDVVVQFYLEKGPRVGAFTLKAKYNERLGIFEGSGMIPDGKWIVWSAVRHQKPDKEDKGDAYTASPKIPPLHFPMGAYGLIQPPNAQKIIIKNVTVWTNTKEGILENASVLISNGKIQQVGKNLSESGAKVIDGKGMHLTPGIIDEHSHIAISKGVNEGGQSISAEVSIGDVVDPTDINIYRQLSGGVTAAQLLHGSANPIGGQSALIKLKWGEKADKMLIPDAPKFIKCALGENVKQANWGDFQTERFPQTRMGVEQVFYDAFNRARQYEKEKATGNYRKDLELEVLLEILDKKRFITCHSYVQSEINMLMHMADSMGFSINTFTHILEGYKLADKMAQHGAGGSTFADWWAYKYEVKDAIPFNAAVMNEQGVVVAINSDDAEMGRRLNQEAAKTVKYGGMSEEDALKTVTLNPAKLLHLEDRMGSIVAGKDADVVLWSDHPLSVQAKAMYTIIDGTIYFDRNQQEQMHQRDTEARSRIISQMLDSNKKGEKSKLFNRKKQGHFHCNTMGEESTTEVNQH